MLVETVAPANGWRPLPAPESAFTVTVNVCDLPTSFVASGAIVMFASTHVFTAGPDPPGPAPTDAVAGSVSRVRLRPPTLIVAEACAVVLPPVELEMTIVHWPLASVVPLPV